MAWCSATSALQPLYSARQALSGFGDLGEGAVLGAISLIIWALILVVTVKYVFVIMHASNRGEGGLLALTALALRTTHGSGRRRLWIMAAGLGGAALFYGDGVITPAISVLSAVEGLNVATSSAVKSWWRPSATRACRVGANSFSS